MVAVSKKRSYKSIITSKTGIKAALSALIGFTFYGQLVDSVDELKKVSFYNETSCKAVRVDDPNNPPDGVKPMSYSGLLFLYDLIPLGLGLLFVHLLIEAISERGLTESFIDKVSNDIIAFSISSMVGTSLFIGITPALAETTCKVETRENRGMFDAISVLFLKFWPVVVAGILGVFSVISAKGLSRI
jgi:hypothetical protein